MTWRRDQWHRPSTRSSRMDDGYYRLGRLVVEFPTLRIPSLFVSRFLSFSLSFFLSFFHFLFLSFSTSFFFSGVVFKPSFFTSSLFLVQFHEPRVYFASSRVSSSHSRSLISLFRIRFIDYQPSSTGFVEFWTNRVALLFCNSLFWCAARWS